jgi:hypothetical protein
MGTIFALQNIPIAPWQCWNKFRANQIEAQACVPPAGLPSSTFFRVQGPGRPNPNCISKRLSDSLQRMISIIPFSHQHHHMTRQNYPIIASWRIELENTSARHIFIRGLSGPAPISSGDQIIFSSAEHTTSNLGTIRRGPAPSSTARVVPFSATGFSYLSKATSENKDHSLIFTSSNIESRK